LKIPIALERHVATYTWHGGNLDDPLAWTPQPPDGTPPPGAGDFADIVGGGTVRGSLSVTGGFFSAGAFDFYGNLSGTNGIQINSGASLTVESGAVLFSSGLLSVGNATASASVTQLSGTIIVSGNEFIFALPPTTQFEQRGGGHTIGGYLEVGATGSGVGRYLLSGGFVSAANEVVGYGALGEFVQSGGTNTIDGSLQLGFQLDPLVGDGTYILGGNAATKLAAQTVVVGASADNFGTFKFNTSPGDKAVLQISGTGGLPGLIVGDSGNGTFIQGGGSLSTTLDVGREANSHGEYDFNGGDLINVANNAQQADEIIGDAGTGIFSQAATSGENYVSGKLRLGASAGGNGTYNLDGGGTAYSLFVSGDEIIGEAGTGTFIQTGGTNHTDKNVIIGDFNNASYLIGGLGGNSGQATLSINGDLTIAKQISADADLQVIAGGIVYATGLHIGGPEDGGGHATVTITDGGRVNIDRLATITSRSVLDVQSGRLFVGDHFSDSTNTAPPGLHVIASSMGGTVFGAGQIKGDVFLEGGNVVAQRGTLIITGNVTATDNSHGVAYVSTGLWATLEINGSCDALCLISGTLQLDIPSKFTGQLRFDDSVGGSVDLVHVLASHPTVVTNDGTSYLDVVLADSSHLDFRLYGPAQSPTNQQHFVSHSDGQGGTVVYLIYTPRYVHGYVSGATVFADANDNGKLDAGESSSTTDSLGHFTVNGTGPLVAIGGFDTSTGLTLIVPLSAPEGSLLITPLTTLVTAVQAAGEADPLQAQQTVLSALDLSPSFDLTIQDPFAGAQGGNPASATVYARGAEVIDTLAMIAATLNGAGASAGFQDVLTALGQAVHGLGAGQTLDLTDSATLASLINASAQIENINVSLIVGGLATMIAASNTALETRLAIDAPEDLLADVSAVELVAEGAASTALLGAGINAVQVAGVVANFTGNALTSAIAGAAAQLPAPIVTNFTVNTDDFTMQTSAGHVVTLTMWMSAGVTVTGSPMLQLNDGAAASFDADVSTATSLVFDYSVGAGEHTADLQATAVSLTGATVQDSGGHAAVFAAAFDVSSGIAVNPALIGGGPGNDTLLGGPDNDTLSGGPGNDILDGAGGHNTAIYSGPRAEYALTAIGDASLTVADSQSARDGTDTLSHIDYLQFADKVIVVADAGHASVARLYSAALDRAPDQPGLNGWGDAYTNLVSESAKAQGAFVALAQTDIGGITIASGFTLSPEFQNKYGSLNDAQFVTQLYNNVLDRDPEPAGLNGWLAAMQAGATREIVLVGFSDSPENIAKTAADWLFQI
jgi:hypothetical protein